MNKPEVIWVEVEAMRLCIPIDMTNEDAESFAEAASPGETESVWKARCRGSEVLAGERVLCADREGCVHITLLRAAP